MITITTKKEVCVDRVYTEKKGLVLLKIEPPTLLSNWGIKFYIDDFWLKQQELPDDVELQTGSAYEEVKMNPTFERMGGNFSKQEVDYVENMLTKAGIIKESMNGRQRTLLTIAHGTIGRLVEAGAYGGLKTEDYEIKI